MSVKLPCSVMNSCWHLGTVTDPGKIETATPLRIEPVWENTEAREWLEERGFSYAVRQGVETRLQEADVIRDGGPALKEMMVQQLVVSFLDFKDPNQAFEFKVRWV